MAVQAQHPSNLFRASNGVFEDASANILRGYGNYGIQPQMLNGTLFSSDPESELTCNLSGSRKRNRDDTLPLMHQQKQVLQQQHLQFDVSCEQNRLMESAATSTSGRTSAVSSSLLSQDLVPSFHNQTIEVDALIRLQNEKLRLGLEEVQKRHIRSLLLALEYRALKRLREKETELDSVRRKNAELEEKVKQMSAENQIWCHVARNNEAIVSNLRTSLEQILLQNSGAAKEGYGDSSDPADDTQSCCYEAVEERTTGTAEKALRENREMKSRKSCKSCLENDVSVLLLPCRHLCLCKECETSISCCPVCKSSKNASLQIFMS
ncbi:hypothetical protein MRB53_027314 [Persea americana]|uniref:Uncharacterized protein n=1 Tax=Persea americana TaxID=3435 RepID=A0ACC2LL92_PERAE|nr:hypothetical protein MRB53_027314 [Persea americana]|eukprot:TRINITY_DN318_c0_g1_i1.p1 TRINITY_DN318_c0_g1~~TRINITY_DN318_c0_g1_i1.p1  ORF type:complete len:322 (+),score=43.90 TRINITY_DN318_c0_g1_i1:171-1136(+)